MKQKKLRRQIVNYFRLTGRAGICKDEKFLELRDGSKLYKVAANSTVCHFYDFGDSIPLDAIKDSEKAVAQSELFHLDKKEAETYLSFWEGRSGRVFVNLPPAGIWVKVIRDITCCAGGGCNINYITIKAGSYITRIAHGCPEWAGTIGVREPDKVYPGNGRLLMAKHFQKQE